jgi:hypothetical protein
MTKIGQSLVATGHVIQGVCYAKPDYLSQLSAGLSPIPPERVGPDGEYDHYGLAKRIQGSFYSALGRSAVAQISVRQRGSAVVLTGQINTLCMLNQLIDLALHAEGTSHVEVQGVQVKALSEVQTQVA